MWTFYADAPAELSCARYFSSATSAEPQRTPIQLEWTGPRSLSVVIDGLLTWNMEMSSTPATRFMSATGAMMPASVWRSKSVLGAMGHVAGPMLGVGRVRLTGLMPNGQNFMVGPRLIWSVAQSTARLGGVDFGEPGPLPEQARLADFWLPQSGIFAVGTAHVENFDPARHAKPVSVH
jgi:hypothetical protein